MTPARHAGAGERRAVRNRINKFTVSMLVWGFAAALVADIVFLALGFRGALSGMLVIVLAGWWMFHFVTTTLPQVAELDNVPAPPDTIPDDLFTAGTDAALITATSGAGWINSLRYFSGPVCRVAADHLAGLEGRRLVVVPEAAAAQLLCDDASRARLEQAAEAGAAVIIDNPTPEAARALGLELAADTVTGAMTWVDSNALGPGPAQQLMDSPLPLTVHRFEKLPARWSDWMRVHGHPAVLTRPQGRGVFVVVLFPWSGTLTQLRQGGEPSLAALAGHHPWNRVPARMRDNEMPLADLLDAYLLGLIRQYVPLCGWWRHPDAAAGTVILTANDDCAGERTSVLFEALDGNGCRPTLFLLPDSGAGAAFSRLGEASPGLLWNRYPLHTFRGAVRRNAHPQVADQAQASGAAVARIHQQRFDGGLDAVFASMQAAGLHADASFGPGPGHQGYVFATGFPFHPVSSAGGAFSLLELPFQVHDRAGAPDREWIQDLVARALAQPYSPVCLALHPFQQLQSRPAREAAALMVRVARAGGMALSDAATCVAFWKDRARSVLASEFDGHTLTVHAHAACRGLALELPARIRGRARGPVTLDGNAVPEDALISNRLPVEPGPHTISVTY